MKFTKMPGAVELVETINQQIDELETHVGNQANPHGVTAEQIVGLNSVATTGYVTIGQKPNSTLGAGATAEGSQAVASGVYSHAEGLESNALGKYSHAEGYRSSALLENCHAEGYWTTAGGIYSHSENYHAIADGDYSHAEGGYTQANGLTSHAQGYQSVANKAYAHAEGYQTKADGDGSHSEGLVTRANGKYSHAEGNTTYANGDYSHVEGQNSEAKGNISHAGGYYTIASVNQYAIGSCNREVPGFLKPVSDDKNLLVIGNGETFKIRSNAFRFASTGKMYCLSAYSSTGADYAEMFEWDDGNPDDEDRRGLFVTLSGDKIQIAAGGECYILGIISGNPSVMGDNHGDQWAGQYVRDIFGTPVLEDSYGDPYTDEAGVEHPGEYLGRGQVVNPDWDANEPYVPRENRREWGAVGMLGKLVVRDDGTCVENGYCRPTEGGAATGAETGYRVMRRLDDSHILVLFR